MAVADFQICVCTLLHFDHVKRRTISPIVNIEKAVLNGAEI